MKIFAKSLFVLLLSSKIVHAAGATEYFFQPATGVSAVSLSALTTVPDPQVDLILNGTKISETKYNLLGYQFLYQYGWSESWAFKLGAGSLTTTSETTTVATNARQSLRSSGMTDYLIGLDGLSVYGYSGLAYGISANLSSEESQRATVNKEGNQFSGGPSYLVHAGGYVGIPSGYVGLNLSYLARQDRNETDQGNPETKSVIKGGNQFLITGFYEINTAAAEYDLRLQHGSLDKTERTTGSVTSTSSEVSTYTMIGLGAQTYLSPSVNLRGEYNYYLMNEVVSPTNSAYRTSPYRVGQFLVRLRWMF